MEKEKKQTIAALAVGIPLTLLLCLAGYEVMVEHYKNPTQEELLKSLRADKARHSNKKSLPNLYQVGADPVTRPEVSYSENWKLEDGTTGYLKIYPGTDKKNGKFTSKPDKTVAWTFDYSTVDPEGRSFVQVISRHYYANFSVFEHYNGKEHNVFYDAKEDKLYIDKKEIKGKNRNLYISQLQIAAMHVEAYLKIKKAVNAAIQNGTKPLDDKLAQIIAKSMKGEVLAAPSTGTPLSWVKDLFPDEVLQPQTYNMPKGRDMGKSFAVRGPGNDYRRTHG